MARMTARYNHIEDHVNVYLSDSLDDIPESEKWDLAVGNPPFFLPPSRGHLPKKPDETMKLPRKTVVTESINLRTYDPDWSIHKKFYAKIKRHMKPGGLVVMQECQRGSDADVFKPMIADGGGRFIRSFAAEDLYGKKNAIYYVVSQW
jgi:methylase of polypeptide subunit release factors